MLSCAIGFDVRVYLCCSKFCFFLVLAASNKKHLEDLSSKRLWKDKGHELWPIKLWQFGMHPLKTVVDQKGS